MQVSAYIKCFVVESLARDAVSSNYLCLKKIRLCSGSLPRRMCTTERKPDGAGKCLVFLCCLSRHFCRSLLAKLAGLATFTAV